MTDEQDNLLTELFVNQKQFISLAGSKSHRLESSYKQLYIAYHNYVVGAQQKALAHIGESKAYSTKKVDPYIAGGAAQGLAGPAAGVYTALEANEKNKTIDYYRAEAKRNVSEASTKFSDAEKKLMEEIRSIEYLLNSIPAITEYRIEQKEKKYQEASKLLEGKLADLDKAKEIFLSLGDYKDSKEMAEKSLQAYNAAVKADPTTKIILIISTILAVIFSYFASHGETVYFIFYFILSFIFCFLIGSLVVYKGPDQK